MLRSKSVLITAGPTWEAIDPVRGISNHSSGKMGYALARAAAQAGAHVYLISGPVCLSEPEGIKTLQVTSAHQMYDAVHHQIDAKAIDVFIGVAAVADYRPAKLKSQKIKKSTQSFNIKLVKNPDIIASVAALKAHRPYTVGFAAETEQLKIHAQGKLKAKNLDMIIANDVSEQGVGFGSDENRVMLMTANQIIDLGKHSKTKLADSIVKHIANKIS